MYKAMAVVFFVFVLPMGTAAAQQNLAFVGDFESGQVRKAEELRDGFFIRTLPLDQTGQESIASGAGGFGPGANSDTRVVQREEVGSETVTPRKGTYFMRSALYRNKNYLGLNGDEGRDKPRSSLALSNPAHRFDYDTEAFLGFSIYVPLSFEDETGTRGIPGAIQLLSVKEGENASRTFIVLTQYVPSASTKARWYLRLTTSATSTDEKGAKVNDIDLGPVDSDRGKWTDFVIHFRENPFSVDTNPAERGIAGAKNQRYEGSKGMLQLWKAEGPVDGNGNRNMVQKIDMVNSPVGLVPHATSKRALFFRIYKYGWKTVATSVKGPVWFGFDEIRLGFASQGVDYSAVDPSRGVSCANGCAEPAATKPRPPASVAIE